jgi:hypothetical protein
LLPFGSESSCLLYRSVKVKIYKAINLPVVLYGCETWCFITREENKMRVSEYRVPWSIYGPKRDEVRGEWRKLHNKEFHHLYSSPNIIRQSNQGDEVDGACGMQEKGKESTRFWWESPKERDHLEDTGIDGKMESEWILRRLAGEGGVDWFQVAQDRLPWLALVNMMMRHRVVVPHS